MLQNKLTLSIIRILLTSIAQNKRKNLYVNFLLLVLISNVVAVVNKTFFSNIKKQLQINFALMFQLTNIAIIILKKNVKVLFNESYNESIKSMKFLIQKL